MLALAAVGTAAGAPTRRRGCTIFDFAGPGSTIPRAAGRYDPTGFLADLSNGWLRQQASSGRIRVDPDVTLLPGLHTVRLEVHPGDVLWGGERADVSYGGAAPARIGVGEGRSQWWAWTTRSTPSFSAGSSWNIIMDFHGTGPGPSANVQVVVDRRTLGMNAYGGDPSDPAWQQHGIYRPLERFVPGKRYDIALGVRWSSDPRLGSVEVWVNGRRAVRRTHVATLWRGQLAYPKLANYRPAGPAWTNVIYDAGFRSGPTRGAVQGCVGG
jgi:hypothetical protein